MNVVLDARGQTLEDRYVVCADEASLPAGQGVIVSLARWRAGPLAHDAAVAVQLPNTADVLTLEDALLRLPMLVLSFPAFGDGRAYSQANRLRERGGYTGKLRATGAAVVADQLAMLARCGIDEFALREDQVLATCQAALATAAQGLPYQPASVAGTTVFAARKAQPISAAPPK